MGRKLREYTFRFLPAATLSFLLLLPVLYLLILWLVDNDVTHARFLIDFNTLHLILRSFLFSVIVAMLATAIGTTCGFILYKLQLHGSSIYRILLILPLLIAPYIFAVAWKDVFVKLGLFMPFYSIGGLITVHTLIYFPLVMLITGSAFMNINAQLEDAGMMVTSHKRMVFKIVLPLLKPALTISLILVFIFSLSEFSVPAFFGVRTFTVEIFTQFAAFYNYTAAIGQSLLLVLVCLTLLFMERRYLSDAPFFSVGVKGNAIRKYSLNKNKVLINSFLIVLVFLSVLVPICMLVYQSFSGKTIVLSKALHLLKPAFYQSVQLALVGALFITFIGLVCGYLQERKKSEFSNYVLLISFVLPSTVLGIALIQYYNQSITSFIYASPLIILIGYIGKFGFIASRIIGNGLKQVPVSLEESARMIIGNPLSLFYKITLPLLLPSLIAGFMLAFVLCLGELGTTIMVYPAGTELMSVKIFTISANAPQSLTSSMTLISFLITLLFILLMFACFRWVYKKYRNV